MSKVRTVLTTAHQLSLAGMEEASREGKREADIEHLLLALTLDSSVAGQVLREQGVTLEAARDAVQEQHAEQLGTVGVTGADPEIGKITFHATRGYEWRKRAVVIFEQAGKGKRRGDAEAVLRSLLIEPSGFIRALLARCGTSADAIASRLDEMDALALAARPASRRSGVLEAKQSVFVPAAIADVLALVRDPGQLGEWDEVSAGSAVADPTNVDVWLLPSMSVGRKKRVPAREVRRVDTGAEHSVQWETSYPEKPRSNRRVVRLIAEPSGAGTMVEVVVQWVPDARRRWNPVGWALRPFSRALVWMQTAQLAGGVSRQFR